MNIDSTALNGGPMAWAEALLRSAGIIAACADRDLESTLNALIRETCSLFGANDASLALMAPNGASFLRHRVSRLAIANSPRAIAGGGYRPSEPGRDAITTRRPSFVADFQNDPRISIDARASFPTVISELLIPLVIANDVIGILDVSWTAPRQMFADELDSAETLGFHAAVAIKSAQQLAADRDAQKRAEVLVEAGSAIAATHAHGVSAVFDRLEKQARQLLGADATRINLIDPTSRMLISRRARTASDASSSDARRTAFFSPSPAAREALAKGHAVFIADFHQSAIVSEETKNALPSAVSAMFVPIIADGEGLGVLLALWTTLHAGSDADLEIADSLSYHSGIAIRGALALHEAEMERAVAQEARDELAAVIDSARNAIFAFSAEGQLQSANRVARERMRKHWGRLATSLDDLRVLMTGNAENIEGMPPVHAVEMALIGQPQSSMSTFHTEDQERHYSVHAVPVRNDLGNVVGAVVVSDDITELAGTLTARAQLEGAVKTARFVAHEINNKLTYLTGYGSLLRNDVHSGLMQSVDELVQGAEDAADTVTQLQKLVRFAEVTGLDNEKMLNLPASIRPENQVPP